MLFDGNTARAMPQTNKQATLRDFTGAAPAGVGGYAGDPAEKILPMDIGRSSKYSPSEVGEAEASRHFSFPVGSAPKNAGIQTQKGLIPLETL